MVKPNLNEFFVPYLDLHNLVYLPSLSLFINDITSLDIKGNIQLYTDDAYIFYDTNNLEELSIFDIRKLVTLTKSTKYFVFENRAISYNSSLGS